MNPKKKINNLVTEFKNKGFIFTNFKIEFKGNYHPDDADWNDKDVLHVNHVHANVSQIPPYIDDQICTSIQFVIIPIIKIQIPIIVLNYEVEKYKNIFVSTMGPIVLIMEKIISGSIKQSKIEQNYYVGTKFFLKFMHYPIKKYLIKYNKFTMGEDVPMREQRSNLRKKGHLFSKKGNTFSYLDSLFLDDNNVSLENNGQYFSIDLSNITDDIIIRKEDSSIINFHILKKQNKLVFWKSICPHQGAYLDINNHDKIQKCPWHGLTHESVATVDIEEKKIEENNNKIYKFQLNWPNLKIELRK